LVVKIRVEMRARTSAVMPVPVSRTERQSYFPVARDLEYGSASDWCDGVDVIGPPAGIGPGVSRKD